MPMFDDPRQSLEQMQKELLEEVEEEYVTEEEWWEKELSEAKAMIGMDDEEESDDYEQYGGKISKKQVRSDYRDTEDSEEPPKEDVRGQLILTFLLVLGILGVAGYWVSIFL